MADLDQAAHRGTDGWSELDHAAACGDVAQVTPLLAAGADPLAEGPDGRGAYDIALAAGQLEAAAALREAADSRTAPAVTDRSWRPFCKAYRLAEMQRFAAWPEPAGGDESPEAGDAIVYVHDDFTVTRSAWRGEQVLLADPSPEWMVYCREVLGFTVPDDFDLAVPADDGRD